ncbi:MAG: DUF4139 domain-containing protein [Treponema sp.]|nr:DUF4139 domain-containing protein [Treponema sp.]
MKKITVFILFFAAAVSIFAQAIRETSAPETALPLRRVVILTSGVAFYEHSGTVTGAARIELPFRLEAINDALKTLIINDPGTANPSVIYQSENTLFETLRSLTIDLSDSPDFATILSRLRGAEVEILAPTAFTGRIIGIEYRVSSAANFSHTVEPWLLLNTNQGFRAFNLKDVSAVNFKDSAIEQDLNRSLDLIAASRNLFTRQLQINLPGTGRRDVSISYVIPSPIWKVSYRLDLGASEPLFQGWAIIDNDSDTDWVNVQLSLVAGRPTSFIQPLYPPFFVRRPVLPLAIAGTAEALTHDRAFGAPAPAMAMRRQAAEDSEFMAEIEMDFAPRSLMMGPAATEGAVAGGVIQTAAGADAGGQFEFTIRHPVTLNRRMSAMLPLVESTIEARRTLIFSGTGRHPRLGAEITNNTGMRLPAGPITVYDGGIYAGSALIEFWNEGENRLISFGEDLSVTASSDDTNAREVNTVTVTRGVMTINRHLSFIRNYTFINSSADSKALILEHNRTPQTTLISPSASEQTPTAYRFNVTLEPNRETIVTVTERRPVSETVALLPLRPDALLRFSTSHEIPAHVQQALTRAVALRQAVDSAEAAVREIETQRNLLVADQDRTRRNLEAAGNQTQQGQEFLRRLVALDSEIDALAGRLETANANVRTARTAFENYLNTLNL